MGKELSQALCLTTFALCPQNQGATGTEILHRKGRTFKNIPEAADGGA